MGCQDEDQMDWRRLCCRRPPDEHHTTNWHPKTFEEANAKLKKDFGKDWDEMYPLDQYYQDMHLNLFPKRIVHAENLGGQLASTPSGRYYIGCFVQKAMEAELMWGRFVAFKEE